MAVTKGTKDTSSGTTPVMTFQSRRWTVGTVVTISIVFAAGLMVLLQFMTFKMPRQVKWDLTSAGINSLNTGTRSVLDGLGDEKIYLTSLYLETDIETDAQRKYREAIDDMMRLYQAEKPSNIEIEWINPLKDQPRLGELLQRVRGRAHFKTETEPHVAVMERFEGEILAPFQVLLEGFVSQLEVAGQGATIGGGPSPSAGIGRAIASWVELGTKVLNDLQAVKAQPMPRYSVATRSIQEFYETVGGRIEFVVNTWADQQIRGTQLDEAVKDVLLAMKTDLQPWLERFEEEKQKIQDLPALDLDALERSLQQNNAIVVESSEGARVLSFEEVWPALREGTFVGPNDFDKRRFAGEGVVTPAILQLIQKEKTALVFVRHAGARLFGMTGFGPTAQRGAHTALKAELEKMNYLVTEWDVKEIQAKPIFDEEPKRTIYIVLRPGPSMSRQGMPMAGGMGMLERTAVLAAVADSGRAVFLTGWEMFAPKYEYREFLSKKWGIDVDGGSMIITAVPTGPGEWGLTRNFHSITRTKFREHALTEGLEFLQEQCVFPMATTIGIADQVAEGVTVAELAFVPAGEDVWAVKDPPSFLDRYQDEGKARKTAEDLTGPFSIALAAGKGEDKIVVFSAGADFINDNMAVANILTMGQGGLQVRRRAPGNLALFLNVLHYLDDTLEWLNVASPMDSSQIEITDRQLAFWRVLAVGVFPALALMGGGLVWYVRRR